MRREAWIIGIGLVAAGCGKLIGLDDLRFDSDAGSDACTAGSCAEAGGAGTAGQTAGLGGGGGRSGASGGGRGGAGGFVSGQGGAAAGGANAFQPGAMTYLKADPVVAYAEFGTEIALDGDTLAVGAPMEGDGTGVGPGAVYIFVRDGSDWRQEQRLRAPPGNAGDYFGSGLALSGDTLVVGAPHSGLNSDGVGAAYVFVRSNDVWTQQAELHAAEQELYDAFGVEDVLSGDALLVTASLEAGPNSTATNSGTVHLFSRTGTSWTHVGYFKAPIPSGSGLFGRHMAVDGNRLAIGAPGGAEFPGSVFIYDGSGVDWTYSNRFDGLDLGDYFGSAVALQGDTLAVGSIWEWSQDPSHDLNSGSAFVGVLNQGDWTQLGYLKASPPQANAWFGVSVFLSGDTMFIGSNRETVGSLNRAGAVHVFESVNGLWAEHSAIHAPNADAADYFGTALAGDAHTLAIGSIFEAGNGSDLADNSTYQAGAVYVLEY